MLLAALTGALPTWTQTPADVLEVDALRYSMTRTEHVDFADGVTFDDLDSRHRIAAYPIPPRTTVYLALREPDGSTTVEMSYPGAAPMPASSLQTASRTVTAYDGVVAYDLDGEIMYRIPASPDDSLYLAEYDFALPRVGHLEHTWRGIAEARSDRQSMLGTQAGAEPLARRTYDVESLTATTERYDGERLVKREVTVYQEIEEDGGALAFPLFTIVSEPFDERGIAGTRIRVLSYSDVTYGSEVREALEREASESTGFELRLFPNPTANTLRITGGLNLSEPSTSVVFEVYGSDGRLVSRVDSHAVGEPIDVVSLRPGTYVARVITPSGRSHATVFTKR